ncbi:DUF58 domain-containing protein [Thalassotalea sp. PS06]|uniref:DUF58 domain-containing protein n=1 Tax=Thalassotalea sp. PS06 TaxID=2594005 RepID=UPI00116452C1|nr:DUF58 domain-containing protein [Thalassotalea sp. PS06]QDP02316.1 DUF58 domain-containing protein [Thalassotalea sp. PS06]
MKLTGVRPEPKLIKFFALISAVLVAALILLPEPEVLGAYYVGAALVLAILVGFDFWVSYRAPDLTIARTLPNNLSFQRWYDIELSVANNSASGLTLQVRDHLDPSISGEHKNDSFYLKGNQRTKLKYRIKPNERGDHNVGGTELCVRSVFGLWQCLWLQDTVETVKVYPDFRRVNQQHSLKGVSNLPIDGLKIMRKRGQGTEFNHLREYRQGDSIRQIDWKSSSKLQKLIAREYQEEQNQHIIVMLDAGQQMSVETSTGSHFDAALNALLMLGHTVLKQGDWFSMQSFNQQERWLEAVKGEQNVSRVMNHFYDLYPDQSYGDYQQAVNQLLKKNTKRSLVLMVTTIDDQNAKDLLPALKRLQRHHLVALVNIENQALREALDSEIRHISDADSYCSAIEIKNRYQAHIKRMTKEGIICVECSPERLLPYVINTYLSVKHSGML